MARGEVQKKALPLPQSHAAVHCARQTVGRRHASARAGRHMHRHGWPYPRCVSGDGCSGGGTGEAPGLGLTEGGGRSS